MYHCRKYRPLIILGLMPLLLVLIAGYQLVFDAEIAQASTIPQPPVIDPAGPISETMDEDDPGSFSVTLGTTGSLTSTLTWSVSSPPAHGIADVGSLPSAYGASGPLGYMPDLNYNGNDTFVIQVKNDSDNLTDTVTVNVTIDPVNDAGPVITQSDPVSVTMSEDGVPTAFSLTLNATDVDGDTLTWGIQTNATHGTATASGTGLSKSIGYAPNLNYNGSDSFVVKVEDGNGGKDTITVNVTIESVNNDPTNISLSSSSVAENRPVGTQVGVLSTTDVDGGPTYVYSLVGGKPDNSSFTIDGDKLKTAAIFDRETKSAYQIRIQTNDQNGGTFAKDFTITVTDVNEPDLTLTKSDNGFVASPGSLIRYELDYANIGSGTAAGVRLIETVPANTTFIGDGEEDASTPGWSCADGSAAGTACRFNLGSVPKDATGTVDFVVRVNTPLPGNVTEIDNTASIETTSPELDLSNNDAAETTPLESDVVLDVSKRGVLLVDADVSGFASPGDTVRYTITIAHSGETSAVGATLKDSLDPNAMLLPDTLATTAGTIVTGNQSGDDEIEINIGSMQINGVVTVTYNAIIRNPLIVPADAIVNQAFVGGRNFPTTPSDDPRLPGDEDATTIPLSARAELYASKVDGLYDDADGSGFASPGDTLAYTITVANTGNRVATSVVLTDVIESNATLQVGTVTADCGPAAIVGNTPGDTSVRVDIGNLAGGGGECTVNFKTLINDIISADAKDIRNQALITSAEGERALSDDPDFPGDQDVTRTNISSTVNIYASMNVFLHNDNDGNRRAGPGDVLLYTVKITNTGNRDAANVTYEDQLSSQVSTVSNSVVAGLGEVTAGNSADSQTVVVQVGNLPGGGGMEVISYKVRINNVIGLEPIPDAVELDSKLLLSQGNIAYRDLDSGALLEVLTDYPSLPGDMDPTPMIVHGAEAIFLPAIYR